MIKYLITYKYDKWKDNCFGAELCDNISEINNAIRRIKLCLYDDDEYQRNIKVYKAEEVTDAFDTKTEYDDEKD